MRRTVSGIMLTLLLMSMLTVAFNIQPVKADIELVETPWSMFGHDAQNTWKSQYIGPQSESIRWATEIEGIYDLVIGVGDVLYALTVDGLVYAINPDGTVKWTYEIIELNLTGFPLAWFTGSLAIGQDGNIYVSSTEIIDQLYFGNTSKIYAINPVGSIEWIYESDFVAPSSLTISLDSTIYFVAKAANGEIRLYALNPNGSLKWSFECLSWGGNYRYPPAIGHDGTIYTAMSYDINSKGQLYAIAPEGTLKWVYETPTDQGFRTPPSIGPDGTIYVGTHEDYPIGGMVYAINPDGTIKWSSPSLGWYVDRPLSIGPDGTIYARAGPFHQLVALKPDGNIKWIDYDTYEKGAVVGADGLIYVTWSTGSRVRAINPDGTTKWSSIVGGTPMAIGSDGTLYTISDKLYAFGTAIERIYGIPVDFRFNKDLYKGNNNPEVRYLQIVLNTDPDTRVATSGEGSPGNETTRFGDLTENAVKKFQKKYGLPETGYVGELTRGKLNEILNNKFTEEYKNKFDLLNTTERKFAIWSDIKSYKSSYPDLSSFPNELILAVAAQETGDYAHWNNEHVANDWGRGIMQITSNIYVGAGGVDSDSEECIKARDRILKLYSSKYYSNTLKGIEANIKDGLYALQDKYQQINQNKIKPVDGYTKEEIVWISAIQRYNVKSEKPTLYVYNISDQLIRLARGDYGLFDGFDAELGRSLGDKFQKAYSESIRLYSHGELRVYDNTGNVTGLVNGQVREEILNSIYDYETKTVMTFFPSNDYYYEIVGTETGTYGLDITSIEDGNATIFTAIDIPTSANATHQYSIDWDALALGEEGVTVQVDSDGDGAFEYTFTSDSELTHDEFIQQTSPTYALTITVTAGGTTDPAPGTYSYTANSLVQVTAIPDANYIFDHWELDTINVGSSNPYTVLMDNNHTLKAVFTYSPPPPSLTVSISPLSASILAGQSVTFTSTVSGGYTPYSYQWYLNGAPVSGATSSTWTFTPTTAGIYYVYLKVTDAKGNTAQPETARITVAAVPVGGYSVPIQLPTTAKPATIHIALLTILTAIFITIKWKAKRKH